MPIVSCTISSEGSAVVVAPAVAAAVGANPLQTEATKKIVPLKPSARREAPILWFALSVRIRERIAKW
jgi:hypothetical protein